MLSSNAGARLLDSEPQEFDSVAQATDTFPSDAATVRVFEVDLLCGDEPEFRYWVVTWLEQGTTKAPRRFWTYRDAFIFSERLKCRLNIDAYARECALLAAKKEGTS